ncbi:MAG: NAD(P)-binding protein [Acidobacteriota bacterium]
MADSRNRELGMHRPITRRDFLNGISLAVTDSLLSPGWLAVSGCSHPPAGESYPPALTGLRGSHEGSYEVAHWLRDGWQVDPGHVEDTGEAYDLVVVGGGLSGLAAAHFFQKKSGLRSKILILDNHDDFGGHARRNEFRHGRRLLLGAGGSFGIENPSKYSSVAIGLIRELGIEPNRLPDVYNQEFYTSLKLESAVFFDEETFGTDRLVVGEGSLPWAEFLARTPLSENARRDIARLHEEMIDYLPGLSAEEKKARLGHMSYQDFLIQVAKVHQDVVPFFQARLLLYWALGIDALPAWQCMLSGLPGSQGMKLSPGSEESEAVMYYFPDGNASVARLLVRSLIPEAVPGKTMDDIVTSRISYGLLDRARNWTRIRLNSTVVNVHHAGTGDSAEVYVTYVRGGKARRVRGKSCVLACYNSMIPHICPELPEKQRQALSSMAKAPMVITHVLVRNWKPFQQLGVWQIHCPGSYHSGITLEPPASLGAYRHPRSPEEPILLRLDRVPVTPGLPIREQFRLGQRELLNTSFEIFERKIRDQLARTLSAGGFDPARDIEAITVNRWPHGYAYEHNPLFDPEWAEEERPWVIGRERFRRVAIANSDAGASAYMDAAFDQAHRAVEELTS